MKDLKNIENLQKENVTNIDVNLTREASLQNKSKWQLFLDGYKNYFNTEFSWPNYIKECKLYYGEFDINEFINTYGPECEEDFKRFRQKILEQKGINKKKSESSEISNVKIDEKILELMITGDSLRTRTLIRFLNPQTRKEKKNLKRSWKNAKKMKFTKIEWMKSYVGIPFKVGRIDPLDEKYTRDEIFEIIKYAKKEIDNLKNKKSNENVFDTKNNQQNNETNIPVLIIEENVEENNVTNQPVYLKEASIKIQNSEDINKNEKINEIDLKKYAWKQENENNESILKINLPEKENIELITLTSNENNNEDETNVKENSEEIKIGYRHFEQTNSEQFPKSNNIKILNISDIYSDELINEPKNNDNTTNSSDSLLNLRKNNFNNEEDILSIEKRIDNQLKELKQNHQKLTKELKKVNENKLIEERNYELLKKEREELTSNLLNSEFFNSNKQ